MTSNRLWIFFLGGIAALCVLLAALIPLFAHTGTSADIYQNGQFLQTLPLDEPASYTLLASNGGSNTIVVQNGRIRVSQATCPDQICVKQGWVNTDTTPIVCLPNQLVIQVKGGESDLDAATG